ncbi:MAG: DNA polymerase III subunit delta [Chromatiales bacterium]|nr:DNA polymerase III subunit delta [Chromatiales bacterium]MDP6150348.1 DNA polymerase III subunit delta [Gammaproteobacteria bacterium]MDP7271596.1 DNA polymerase III subunit delta [Gammaproteobacteria bacterium]HJP03871.1 DNA polymerase III subunit delta [Gammaproteobacteria bacterium]
MKITADKITSQLSKGLSPVWFISGDQPLLVGEAMDAVRAAARAEGFDERESHVADARFNWDKLLAGLDNLSLFANRKIVEVRLATGKPGREGGAAIAELVANPPPDTLFIISSPKLDSATSKTKWAKTIATGGVYVDVRAPGPGQLPGWLRGRLRAAGLECDDEALELLALRVEGNLLAAQQEISKLSLLAGGKPVTAEVVQRSVADGARYDVFQLADAAIGQDVKRAVRILYGLRREGVAPELTLWALARESSTLVSLWTRVEQGTPPGRAMSEARVWSSRQPMLSRALRSHDQGSIRRLAAKASLTDRIVKGASPGLPWNALLELVLLIAQPQRPMLAGYEA